MVCGLRARLGLLGGLLWLVGGAAAAGRNEPLTTAQLLVDLARDYGLTVRGHQTEADVQHVRTLLEAAVRLDPKQGDAYMWLYELARLEGDPVGAARALNGLLEAEPTHQGAFALWLAAGTRVQQTAEKRAEWLQAVAGSHRPPAMLALVHVELARLALERLDVPAARTELDRALELEPACLEAATLALHTLGEDAAPTDRLRAALRVLQLNPLSLESAWRVALLLNDYGYADEAGRFYDFVRDVHAHGDNRATLPGNLLLDMARNRLARDRLDEAIELARQAVNDPATAAEAGMALYYLLQRKGLAGEATEVRQALGRRFALLTAPEEWPPSEVAQAAWFYCTLDPQPHLALPRAESAAERAGDSAFAQRVLGWAQALNLKTDAARRTLEPIATRDPFAAYMLARLLHDAGEEGASRRILENIDPPPICGAALDLIATLRPPVNSAGAASQAESQPTTAPTSQPAAVPPATAAVRQRFPEIERVLAGFDNELLKFVLAPGKYVEAQITLDDLGPAPGEPWLVTYSLTNRGPFPITLGPGGMLNPVFVVSLTMEGDQQRRYPALLNPSVDAVRVLYPGQMVRLRRTIDVGPPRYVSRQTPQQLQRVTLQALLDAERGPDGQWRPSLGGQVLRPVYFNRVPMATGREALVALFSALAGDSNAARVRAIEVVAELLGERQRADLKKLGYDPAPVPAERLRAALLSLLGSESWELRVRTLDGLQVVGLDQELLGAVEQCAEHSHWLVRMMAMRVLARQGPTFAERAASIARNDPDELVRALAESYVNRWAQPASAPTTQRSEPGQDR